jgi:hypothetical protein
MSDGWIISEPPGAVHAAMFRAARSISPMVDR